MKRIFLSTIIIFLGATFIFAQESKTLSLQQCVQIAVEENINIKTARIDREKSQYKKAEAISAIIPKISAGANFQDNVIIPTTMLPGEIIGKPGTTVPV